MKREQVRDYKAGQQITTGRINQLVRAARRDVTGQPPIVVQSVGNTWQIVHTPHKWDWFPARIQAKSSDFSDQQYWIRPVRVSNSDGDYSDVLTWEDAGTVPSDLDVVAVNLAESDTHRLPTDGVVIVFRQEDDSSPTNYRHFMSRVQSTNIQFAKVLALTWDAGTEFVKSVTANPCNAAGGEINDTIELTLKATDDAIPALKNGLNLKIGFSDIEENDIVGYLPSPAGDGWDGTIVVHAGLNGAILTGPTALADEISDAATRMSIVGGPGIAVDNTDPQVPIVSADVTSNKGLIFSAPGNDGTLEIKPNANKAIEATVNGIGVVVNPNHGLGVDSDGLFFWPEGGDLVYSKPDNADGWITYDLTGRAAHGDPQTYILDTASDL